MTSLAFNVVAFDLDGTLADTAPDLAASLNHALTALGRDTIDPQSVRYLVGHGARALLRRGLAATGEASEELVEQGFPLFIDYYAANICAGTRAYPEVEATLDALTGAGIAVALCTNKPEGLTHRLLNALGWSERFASIVGGDTLPVRKPDPAPLLEARLPAPAAGVRRSSETRSRTRTRRKRPGFRSSRSASASPTGLRASSAPKRSSTAMPNLFRP